MVVHGRGDERLSIPGYELLQLLGRGGMGEVYRARQISLDRPVAVKLIHPQKQSDPHLAARFAREARLLARLSHPHIVAVYDSGEVRGQPFLVMELVEGRNLRSLTDAERLAAAAVVDLMRQLCDAVSYAHDNGIVHRDLKPENILIDSAGRVKVADFGLARLLQFEETQSALTKEGAVLGTFRYMAPEQLAGASDIDARADVYALGVIFYELLTGKLPQGRLPAPGPGAEIDQRLEAVIGRALSYERAERFATARELGTAIAAATEAPAAGELFAAEKPVAGRVPQPPSRLIGRSVEVAALLKLCRAQRLTSLLGPGGTGKTRLAIEVAREAAREFADGAWFVELGEVAELQLMASTIARVLEVREGGEAIEARLASHLRDRQLLLVLDNCEQLPGVGILAARLLESSPGLRILATSRTPLRVRGEHEFPLSPLAVPADRPDGTSLESAAAAPAVQLFLERAQAIRPDLRLTSENVLAVVQICRRLDGLPLALELAAARLRLLSPAALAPRLDQALKVLTGGALDLPPRQRTLRAAIAWSYDLLNAGQRALFRRLSVFSGNFSLEAAEQVCAELPSIHSDFELLDGLTALVEHSLIRAAPDEGRFEMLATLREFAAEQLAAEGEESAARGAFVEWGAQLLEAAAPHLDTAAAGEWLTQFNLEWNNWRAVLQFLAERDPARALQLAGRTWYAGYLTGHLAESRDRLLALLAMPDNAAPTADRGTAAHGAATLCWVTGEVEQAWRLLHEALAIRREQADPASLAATLNNMGVLAREQSDYEAAERYHAEALALRRAVGNPGQLAASLANLGLVASDRGEIDRAQEHMREALELYRQLGDEGKAATVLGNLGRAAMMQERPDEAAEYAAEALRLHRKLGSARGMILARLSLAAADSLAGQLPDAESSARESFESATELGDAWLTAYAEASLGFVAERRRDHQTALRHYRSSLRHRMELGDVGGQGELLERIGVVLHDLRQDGLAVRLLGAEQALQRRIGYVRFPAFHAATQAILAELRARLGAEAVERELAHGAAAEWSDMLQLALAEP
ncbi:MAG: protein kinase [Pirellulaceae bacterium]|nr:protein kinase [Pirellulaceae bacterium]